MAGEYENNIYLIVCATTGKAVLIDAAAEAPRIISAGAGTDVTAILTTHGHFDHIGAVQELQDAWEIPFRLHPADTEIAQRTPDDPLSDGATIAVGELRIDTIWTPGHTPGSTCFLVEDLLFTGDTLFPGGPGATRFPYADFDQIMRSLESRLFILDDATPFFPGHGKPSTIGEERPSLEDWRTRRW